MIKLLLFPLPWTRGIPQGAVDINKTVAVNSRLQAAAAGVCRGRARIKYSGFSFLS